MSYASGSQKLIVAAIVCGLNEKHCRRIDNVRVLLNPAQALPCFVIHYRTVAGAAPAKRLDNVYSETECKALSDKLGKSQIGVQSAALLRKQRIQAMTQRARAQLPFGYGPGGNFQVLDMADYDDDDEQWGEYQEDRSLSIRWSKDFQSDRFGAPGKYTLPEEDDD
jgi:hypothetical protein